VVVSVARCPSGTVSIRHCLSRAAGRCVEIGGVNLAVKTHAGQAAEHCTDQTGEQRGTDRDQPDCGDVTLGTGASVLCEGKGRKQRAVPLTGPVEAMLRVWLAERAGCPRDPLFPTRTGRRLSRDAIALRVSTHAATAAQKCPSLQGKKIHPHVLRHSCAMTLLQAGVDTSVIALWLGHAGVRSTDAYVHADISIKEKALALTTPAAARPGRYHPPDKVLAFLESL